MSTSTAKLVKNNDTLSKGEQDQLAKELDVLLKQQRKELAQVLKEAKENAELLPYIISAIKSGGPR